MSGAPVFSGTRVPIFLLFDYLTSGNSVADFRDGFPQVTLAQVNEVLREAGEALLAKLGASST